MLFVKDLKQCTKNTMPIETLLSIGKVGSYEVTVVLAAQAYSRIGKAQGKTGGELGRLGNRAETLVTRRGRQGCQMPRGRQTHIRGCENARKVCQLLQIPERRSRLAESQDG